MENTTNMTFSQRKGFKPVKKIFQIDSMDTNLRNGLWNNITVTFLIGLDRFDLGIMNDHMFFQNLCQDIWQNYFTLPIDEIQRYTSENLTKIRTYFFDCKWYEVFDFIEFLI